MSRLSSRPVFSLAGTLLLLASWAPPGSADDFNREDPATRPIPPENRRPALLHHTEQRDLDAALIRAAGNGDTNGFNQAIARGANLHAVDALGNNAVLMAAEGERYPMLRLLLDKGVDPDARGASGFTPLTYAIVHGRADDVRLLLKAGADPNLCNAVGSPPLHLAVEFGRQAMIGELVADGARLEGVNADGESAVITAVRIDNRPALDTLLALGADADARDKTGRSGLFWAVLESREDMAIALLQHGAHVASRSKVDGYTPLQLARVMQHQRVLAAIRQRDGLE